MAWSRKDEEVLARLWKKGLTSGQIAKHLGPDFNRNMVVGKSRRMGLERRPSPIRKTNPNDESLD